MFPKKNLGQNFLKNKLKIRKIIDCLKHKDGDFIIEVGSGNGELTKELLKSEKEFTLIAIEKDDALAIKLKENITDARVKILQGDALELIPSLVREKKLVDGLYKIFGNIPYYITGYLLRTLGNLGQKPSLTVLTIQKEVAQRICAVPPKMNLLSASVRVWGNPKIFDTIGKNDFSPKPKVDSAIISIVTKPQNKRCGSEFYYPFIKILFKQPRKTAVNNLLKLKLPKEYILDIFQRINIPTNARPQDINIEIIKKLSEIVYNEMEICS